MFAILLFVCHTVDVVHPQYTHTHVIICISFGIIAKVDRRSREGFEARLIPVLLLKFRHNECMRRGLFAVSGSVYWSECDRLFD